MKLRPFEQQVKEASGYAQDIVKQFYDKDLSQNSAKKYLAGIRVHLDYVEKLEEERQERQIGEMEETVVKADGTVTSKRLLLLSEEDSKSPKRIMELMGYDVLKWELVSCKVRRNYWDVTMKLKQGTDEYGNYIPDLPHKETNHAFEVTVSVKPIQNALTSDMIAQMFSELKAPKLTEHTKVDKSGLLLELPIMDLHLGKLSWDDETGQNYKLQIASKLYKKAILEIIGQIKEYGIQIERVVFPVGQDFFHFDTDKQTTTAGTQMDSDTRWQKMFSTGVELAIWAITQLSEIAPVDIMYVASNHDKVVSYCLVHVLAAWFRNSKRVKVTIEPKPQIYYDWGKVLIGYSHGDKEGKRIDVLMQADVPKLWGKTIFREWHLGHLHSEQVREIAGVIIRNMASITSIDSWHTEHGYRSLRKAQAILWDKEKGKRLTIDVNVKV